MATERQIAANQRNARKCTGPRTLEGKARAAQNARKHGLCAEDVILDDPDDIELYYELQSEFTRHYNLSDDPAVACTINMALTANFHHNFIVRCQKGAKRVLINRASDNLWGPAPLPSDPAQCREVETRLLGLAAISDLRADDTLSKFSRYQIDQARLFQRLVKDLRRQRAEALAAGAEPVAKPVETEPEAHRPVLVKLSHSGNITEIRPPEEIPPVEPETEPNCDETKPISIENEPNQPVGIVQPCPVCIQHRDLRPTLGQRPPLEPLARQTGLSVVELWRCRLHHCEDPARFFDVDVASLCKARLFDAPAYQPIVRIIDDPESAI